MSLPKGNATSPAALVALLILMTLAGECLANLKVGFYAGKCGQNDVESIVFNVVKEKFVEDPTIVAALLRLHFHDCFVKGCDAAILLDGSNTEKTDGSNESVRGYEVIDDVKTALEKVCHGVVSCADIIAIATRAVVVLAGGISYNVETGRRDGLVSLTTDAESNLLGPTVPVSSAIQEFATRGIDKEEFILLIGAHTTGMAHCNLFQDRLYNFNGVSGKTDPIMNPLIVPFLKMTCPSDGTSCNSVFLDQSSQSCPNTIDNGFFKAIVENKGVLQIDQSIAVDPSTKAIVSKYASNNDLFLTNFGQAMVKLGRMGVLTGDEGQVRSSCRRPN